MKITQKGHGIVPLLLFLGFYEYFIVSHLQFKMNKMSVEQQSSKLVTIFKILGINFLVLVGLLLALNICFILLYEVDNLFQKPFEDSRGTLDIYKEIPWAKQHFHEFENLPTEYRSFVGWRRLAFQGETITINEEGIRRTTQHPSVKDEAPHIALLGGSTMWGTGSDDPNTIPSLLAQALQGDYQTINLGETAYNAYQGTLFLQQQLIHGLRPKIVIAYDGVNDRYLPEEKRFLNRREGQINEALNAFGKEPQQTLSIKNYMLKPLMTFIGLVKSRFQKPMAKKDKLYTQEELELIARRLLESWLASKHLAENYGAQFIPVLQPNSFVGSPNISHLKLSLKPNVKNYYNLVRQLIQTPPYQELRPNFLDLTDVLDGEEQVYIDFCHLTPRGNALVVASMAQHLSKLGLGTESY